MGHCCWIFPQAIVPVDTGEYFLMSRVRQSTDRRGEPHAHVEKVFDDLAGQVQFE